ncbi:MAG: hypothetical protein DVB25_04655 [Verrucomicrobia bacterium]|nr:MAG: hypothetical protein DVB25_04655 [Verrucomicrobiota bacterium]
MNGRSLMLVNAAGCVILGLLLVLQWRKERTLVGRIDDLQASWVAAQDASAATRERAETLEREQAMLKESIASLQHALAASGQLLAQRDAQVAVQNQQLATCEAQLKTWQAAVALRDERLRALTTDLANARHRLDEAIARLNNN